MPRLACELEHILKLRGLIQGLKLRSRAFARSIAIEVAGEPQGVVIPSAEGFRFLAVRLPVFPLDGVIFESVEAARAAAAVAVDGDLDE